MNSRTESKKISIIFFECSLAEHTRVYDCPQGVMEGGVRAWVPQSDARNCWKCYA